MIFAKEIETKYRADEISLADFTKTCLARKPQDHKLASGWDHFYDSRVIPGFFRHRIGPDFNQMTLKIKTSAHNNYIRTEHNAGLTKDMTVRQIEAMLKDLTFKHNKSIYKNCFIYKYLDHTVVFYVIYDEANKQIGRFIEIEMAEDQPWVSEHEAWDNLVNIEKEFKDLGLTARGRMRRSLYELVCE